MWLLIILGVRQIHTGINVGGGIMQAFMLRWLIPLIRTRIWAAVNALGRTFTGSKQRLPVGRLMFLFIKLLCELLLDRGRVTVPTRFEA